MSSVSTSLYILFSAFLIIVFKTPVDISESRGDYTFPQDVLLVEPFSGLYTVIRQQTTISSNKFTQVLRMNRVRNQQESSSTSSVSALVNVDNPTESFQEKALEIQRIASAADLNQISQQM